MNARLFNGNISRASNRKIPHLASAGDLLHCGISSGLRAAMGQERRIGVIRNISALPPRADVGADIVEPPLRADCVAKVLLQW